MNQGCLRPLLISTGLLLLFGLVLGVIYRDTFSLMYANVRAMGEGADLARSIEAPEDLLDYLAEHPEHVALHVVDLGAPEPALAYQAEAVRAVAGLPRLLVLAGFASDVADGRLDPEARVALDTLALRVLPGTDQGTHARALTRLRAQADADSTVTLGQLAAVMVAENDPAATDLLIERLGAADLARLPGRLGLPSLEPPLPHAGVFLTWDNHTIHAEAEDRMASYAGMDDSLYASLAHDLARVYRADAAFHAAETERLTTRGTDLSLQQQRALARSTFSQGTAAGYADLLARALRDSLLTAPADSLFLSYLEQAFPDTTGARLAALGAEAGSFPGLISFAGYARRSEGAPPRIVVLLMDEVPISVFYHLMQTGIDKGFALQLLADDAFVERVQSRLAAPLAESAP